MPRTAVFAAGMAYLMLLVSDLNWSMELIFPQIGLRAVAVGLVAWLRYRRENVWSVRTGADVRADSTWRDRRHDGDHQAARG